MGNVYGDDGKQTVCSTFSGAKAVEGNIEFIPEWSCRYYREDEDGKDFISSFVKAENGVCYFKNIPVKDYPLLITFGDFVEIK